MNSNSGTIGRWQGAGLMATTLLGTGVFILPQMTIEKAHSGALVAWILLTLAIIPVALVFGRLASVFPHAAGPAYFVEKAFGRTAGQTIGLIFLLVVPMGAPAAILMTFQFVNALIPISGWSKVGVEILVIFGLFLINLRGIQVSAKLQFGLTLCIVAVVVVLFGASSFQQGHLTTLASHGMPEMPTVMIAAGIAFWSFLGIEAMTHLADDFRRPQQDMIPAMMMGTVLVGVIYVACTLLLLLVPTDKSVAMIGVFDQLLGGYGAQVIGVLGIASGLATVNVYAASAARLAVQQLPVPRPSAGAGRPGRRSCAAGGRAGSAGAGHASAHCRDGVAQRVLPGRAGDAGSRCRGAGRGALVLNCPQM